MVEKKRLWTAGGLGLAMLLLSLWGVFRGGTAAELLPETPPEAPDVTAEPAQETGRIVRKYDANKYIRTKPLRDPFRLPAEAGEKPAPTAAGGTGMDDAESPPSVPVLQGVLILGEDRRAMIADNGETKTVRTGEQVGQWTVADITGKQVVLSGPGGQTVLTL